MYKLPLLFTKLFVHEEFVYFFM